MIVANGEREYCAYIGKKEYIAYSLVSFGTILRSNLEVTLVLRDVK